MWAANDSRSLEVNLADMASAMNSLFEQMLIETPDVPVHRRGNRNRKKPTSQIVDFNQLKLTNLGSRGRPSGPTPSLLKRSMTTALLASSKLTPLAFMILWTSCLPLSSKPARLSPASMFADKSKVELCIPEAASDSNDEGVRGL